jgi:hypothetical protein
MAQTLRYNSGHLGAITARSRCYNQIDPLARGLQSPAWLFSMFSFRQIAGFLLVLGFLPVLAFAAPQKAQNPRTVPVKASARTQVDPVAQPATPPAPPPTPEQMPAQAPQVSYLNGQLTIISRNSTLSDILHAVARQTGAAIELPPGAGFERVAGRMGPGPARNVLSELLNGSRYDYVMIASASNPGGLQHVILSPKTAGGDNPSPAPPPVATYQPQPQPDEEAMPNEPDMAPPDTSADDQQVVPTEEPPQQAPPGEAPQAPPGEPPQKPDYPPPYQPGAQPGGQQAPGVKTPEQLLQELQRMQQQQQQQQQQQNPQQ